MKPASRTLFILAALAFHAALIMAGMAAFSGKTTPGPQPLPVTVELVPPSVAPPSQEAPQAPPAPLPPPPETKVPRPKPVLKPAPPPAPKKKPTLAEELPARQADAASESTAKAPSLPDPGPASSQASSAPTPQSPAPPPPTPPVRTGVSISASYAASNRKPLYPATSRRYEEQGTVVLRVQVRADGTAGAVEVKSSSGYPALDDSAKTTVQTWRFNPATSDGKPITEWYELSIPFKLEN
jgi:protein TonB